MESEVEQEAPREATQVEIVQAVVSGPCMRQTSIVIRLTPTDPRLSSLTMLSINPGQALSLPMTNLSVELAPQVLEQAVVMKRIQDLNLISY